MTVDVRVEPYGPGAARALARSIAAAQGDDPLARVTVVVPNGRVGLATRRLLASGRLGAARPGIVNVRFLSMAGLAEEIGGARASRGGRRPATGAVLHAAARAVLGREPGPLFGPVRDHPATLSALVATYRELRRVPPAALQSLAGASEQAAEVVRLVGAVRRDLAAWHDEVDVAEAAGAEVREDPAPSLAEVGPLVVYLPLTMAPAHEALVHAIARHVPVTVVLGRTGDPLGDEPAADLAARLGAGDLAARLDDGPGSPVAQLVVSAPSADAEVLLAVRDVMTRHRQGTPLERMALVDGGNQPYARLVREVLDQAQIPYNGRVVRPLSATLAGRILLGALALPDQEWRRDQVMAWIASAPLVFRGRPVPSTAWDLLSAEAGVTTGLPGWRDHLSEARRARGTGGETVVELLEFVEELAGRLAAPPTTWSGWVEWSLALLHALSGGPSRVADWRPEETAAYTAVEEMLAGLRVLDQVDPGPGLGAFRSTLSSELEVPAPQISRFGRGLLVGRIDELVGLDLDTIFVVGMTDGAFPARVGDDPLVPDHQRRAHDQVPLRGARASESRRDYLAALASAEVRILSYARGDQRGGGEQRPSRWLSHGDPRHPALVTSYTAAVAGAGEPVSIDDRDLRSLLRWTAAGHPVDRHYLVGIDPVLRRGLEAQRGRRGTLLTRFDGRVDGLAVPSPADGGEHSVTGLETYAACPRRYFFEHVLGVQVPERPEEIVTVSAADRGTMVHRILEQFVGEQVARPPGQRIRPDTPWGPADVARLLSLADAAFADYTRQGRTGQAVLWEVQKAAVVRDLRRFLVEDSRYRREHGAVPEAVEHRFGIEGTAAVAVPLDDRRTVRFRGSVDRVDRCTGPVYVVIDYKTGGAYGVDQLADDPVARGTKLQLPVYALAVRQHMGAAGVTARYWFVSERGGFAHYGYELTPARTDRLREVVRILVDGVEAGRFPARPAQEGGRDKGNCGICPFDEICPTDRQRAWERKRHDPVLAAYTSLAEADGPG